jgi:hypothetical protein
MVTPGTRSRRQVEPRQRHLHRARGDVDDASELAAHHGIDDLLRELDGGHHVGHHAVEHLLARQSAEIPQRRTAVVVDENVRLGARGQQRSLTRGIADVGDDARDRGAGCPPQIVNRGVHRLGRAAVEEDITAGLRQRLGAGASQAAARRAHERAPPANPEVHWFSPSSGR